MSSIVVHKYGGSSVADIERINTVANHIASQVRAGKKPVVVVSAMGSQTNELLAMAQSLNANPPKRELDMLLSAGERIATALLSIALHKLGIPSLSFTGSQVGIITDENYGNAHIQTITGTRIKDALKEQNVVIVAGFQGVSAKAKDVTTLGRGGSDLTAIALAIFLNAEVCELYKDVTGIFSTDPKRNLSANKIGRLTWSEMRVLAEHGAKVLHHRAAFLAQKFKLPYIIRSSFDFNEHGSLIVGDYEMEAPYIRAITVKKDLIHGELVIEKKRNTSEFFHLLQSWLKEGDIVPVIYRMIPIDSQTMKIEMAIPENFVAMLQKNLLTHWEEFKARFNTLANNLQCLTLIGGNLHIENEIMSYLMSHYQNDIAFIDAKSSVLHIGLTLPETALLVDELHQRFVKGEN